MLAFAHRGGAYHPEIEGLENTLAAFKHAVALGYDYLETDVHVTADGVLLAFHDSVLDRVTDQKGAIADLTFEEVRRALVGGREQVPTLAQLFDEFPEARFNIDLKSDGAVARARRVRRGARGLGPGARRLVQPQAAAASSGGSPTAGCRRPPRRSRSCSSGSCRAAGSRTGSPAARWRPCRSRTAGAGCTIATRGLVRRAHAAGRPVHVWTVDDPDEMRQLLDRGVDGIFTDRTDVLKDVLTERGNWRESAQHDDH